LPKNKTSKKFKRKFRLLLDSAFAKPQSFPRLSQKANLIHVVHDCGLSPQAEDQEIYQKAIKTDRFVLTINLNDFKKLIKNNKIGIIAIESQLSNDEIDRVVSVFISGKNPDDFRGKATRI
jgi:hypothetical protein